MRAPGITGSLTTTPHLITTTDTMIGEGEATGVGEGSMLMKDTIGRIIPDGTVTAGASSTTTTMGATACE